MNINLLPILLFIPFFYVIKIYFIDEKNYEGFLISANVSKNKKNIFVYIKAYFHYIFFIVSTFYLIIGLANPKKEISTIPIEKKGLAIVFCIDVSSSMMAIDFGDLNRLEIAKQQIVEFIKKRPIDYYSIVIFAKNAFTFVPLTFDNQFVIERINQIYPKILEDGTAIGYGLMMAIEQLKDYEGSGKLIILLSDGNNNSGLISPIDAAYIAKKYKISIIPIALGKEKEVLFPFKDKDGKVELKKINMPINFNLLKQLANITGSDIVLNPLDISSLKSSFEKIDNLNKIIFKVPVFIAYQDNYLKYFILSYIFFTLFLFSFLINQKVEF